MENQDKFSTFDRALLAICLIVVLLCTFLMIDGRFLFGGEDTSKLSIVGQIEQSQNDVRQKHEIGFSWRGVRGEDQVFEGDSIFTGDGSKAKIKFAGGGELEIDPKSLVVIRTRNGKLELDLRYGAFSGKIPENQNIVVIKDGEKKEFKASGLPLKISDKEIEKPQALVKGINLVSPQTDLLYWSGDINYSWNDAEDKAPYIVEFSGGPTFKKKLAEFETPDTEITSKPDFKLVAKGLKREFYWRVRSKQKRNLVSEVRKVTVYKDAPPALSLPLQDHVYFIQEDKPETKLVELSWTEPSLSQDYNVQVAKDEGFNELVIAQSTQTKSFKTSSLEQGEYYWRVQGNHPARSNSPWSEVRKFDVIDRTKIAPPSLAASEKLYILPLEKVLKKPSHSKYESLGVPVTDYPIYKWKPVFGAKEYALEVSKDKGFAAFATQKVKAPATEFKFSVMKPGMMAWRVRTVFKSGEKTEASLVSVVKTELPPPPEKSVEPTNKNVKVAWEPLIFARFYELQWDTTDQFTAPTSAVTDASDYLVEPNVPPQSSLFYRVRALDKQKRPLSAFSEPRVLRAVRKLASNDGADQGLTRPVGREPRMNSSVVSFDGAPVFVNFKWSKVRQVEMYRFELSSTIEFTEEPIYTAVVDGDQLLFSQKLPPGQYYWRVRGENEEGSWTVWSDPAPFVVQFR